VTGHLLDTNTVLLALTRPSALRREIRKTIETGPNVLSTVAYWEVVLKTMKGLLEVRDLRTWWTDALDQLAAAPLLLRPEHVAELQTLPPIHKDPFDRMIISQAAVEGLALLTTDREVVRYASNRVRIRFALARRSQ
jgi:PIN domain nuclease of toxin-antitoxin system